MNLINMKTGGRVSSSSSKHNELLNRYREEDPNFREASQLEYELVGLLNCYGADAVATAVRNLVDERERLQP